jgi:hypothetical protein
MMLEPYFDKHCEELDNIARLLAERYPHLKLTMPERLILAAHIKLLEELKQLNIRMRLAPHSANT